MEQTRAKTGQNIEEEQFFKNVIEFKDIMEGQKLADIVLWDPFCPEMEFVNDLLEKKQQEEIEYEFL